MSLFLSHKAWEHGSIDEPEKRFLRINMLDRASKFMGVEVNCRQIFKKIDTATAFGAPKIY